MVVMIVSRKIPATTMSTCCRSCDVLVTVTSPDIGNISRAIRTRTAQKAGRESISRLVISALSARNIIRVVTSPVIIATPPEFTAKTAIAANLRVFCAGNCNERMRATDTSVAVILSASDEKTKANKPVSSISFRSDICCGSTLKMALSINPFLLR